MKKLLLPLVLVFAFFTANATTRNITVVSYTGAASHYFLPINLVCYVGDTVVWTLQTTSDLDTSQTNVQVHSQWAGSWPGAAALGTHYLSQLGSHSFFYVVMQNPTQNGVGCQYNGSYSGMQANLAPTWFTGVPSTNAKNNFTVLNNPVTGNNLNITISLKQGGKTEVSVYDLLGKKVAVLMDEELSAGETSKTFVLNSNYQNGFYFISLKQGEMIMTRKILIQ